MVSVFCAVEFKGCPDKTVTMVAHVYAMHLLNVLCVRHALITLWPWSLTCTPCTRCRRTPMRTPIAPVQGNE